MFQAGSPKGWAQMCRSVRGELAISRALGDLLLKNSGPGWGFASCDQEFSKLLWGWCFKLAFSGQWTRLARLESEPLQNAWVGFGSLEKPRDSDPMVGPWILLFLALASV